MAIPKFTTFTSGRCPSRQRTSTPIRSFRRASRKRPNAKGFGDNLLFRDWRYDAEGRPIAAFPLNDPRYEGRILVAGRNFGCGSSREHAAWALADYGFPRGGVEFLRRHLPQQRPSTTACCRCA